MTDTYDDDNWPRLLGELGLTEEEEGAAVALLVNKDAAYRKGMLWSHSLAVSRRAILGTLKALGELRPSLYLLRVPISRAALLTRIATRAAHFSVFVTGDGISVPHALCSPPSRRPHAALTPPLPCCCQTRMPAHRPHACPSLAAASPATPPSRLWSGGSSIRTMASLLAPHVTMFMFIGNFKWPHTFWPICRDRCRWRRWWCSR